MSNDRSPAADGSSTLGTLRMCASSGTMATLWLPKLPQDPPHRQPHSCKGGEHRMRDETHEQTIEAPPVDVWGFMVDPAALSAWFGADAWLTPKVEEQVRFRFADGSER